MSGVWMFKDGICTLVANPLADARDRGQGCAGVPHKVLVHGPTNKVVTSYRELGSMLLDLGWEPYPNTNPRLLQYHNTATPGPYLISLPSDFTRIKSMHMFDIVVQTGATFVVRDSLPPYPSPAASS